MLDLSSLRMAIEALERSVAAAEANLDSLSADLQDTVRAGVIQNFEVAYERAWKFIQRWLRENLATTDADHPRTRKELFRMAAKAGLIPDPTPWFVFSDARNLTSHTYNKEEAASVYEIAAQFLAAAKILLVRLEASND